MGTRSHTHSDVFEATQEDVKTLPEGYKLKE